MSDNPYAAPVMDDEASAQRVAGSCSARQVQGTFTWWMVTFWSGWGLMLVGLALMIVGEVGGQADGPMARGGALLALISMVVLLLSLVLGCILLHRCWSVLPRRMARTTPGRAVGFLFIPLFQLYWMFVAYHGLAVDLGQLIRRKRLRAPAPSAGMAQAMATVWVLTITPLVGGLAALAWPVLFFLVNLQISNAAIAILNHRAAAPAVAA